MDMPVKNLIARLGMLGVEHHCNEEALSIAQWLAREPDTAEAACAIRMAGLMGLGRCSEALAEGKLAPWPSLGPWLALCEYELGHISALDQRLEQMMHSDDPELVRFAEGMCARENA